MSMIDETPSTGKRDMVFWMLAILMAVILLGIVGDLVRLAVMGGP